MPTTTSPTIDPLAVLAPIVAQLARQALDAETVETSARSETAAAHAAGQRAAYRHAAHLLARLMGAASTPVTIAPCICEDKINKEMLGKPMGTEFTAGGPDSEVMIYLSDTEPHYPYIDVFMCHRDPFHIEEVEAALPALLAILVDPRFIAARAAKEAEWAGQV